MSIFLQMALAQFVSYTNLVVNIRAIAHQHYVWAVITDGLASLIGYFIVRKVAKNDSPWAPWGMAVGGMLASVVGIYVTKHWG